jgi:SAM-dependent methyltransferase
MPLSHIPCGYYKDKVDLLRHVFGGKPVSLTDTALIVGDQQYPIVNDVIVLLPQSQWPSGLRGRATPHVGDVPAKPSEKGFSQEIQFTFGVQWNTFSGMMEEHEKELSEYFDLTGIDGFRGQVICDLGCGMGRWSYFLAPRCRNVLLVDFSEAIFAARRTLRDFGNALFFMGDVSRLPFAPDFADFIFSLGVLHHVPIDALSLVRALKPLAPRILIYLYYRLENRPFYFRILFLAMSLIRRGIGTMRNEWCRSFCVDLAVYLLYLPFAMLARVLRPLGWQRYVPLHAYADKSVARIRQDAYDKLLTRIEQRFTRDQILALTDTFTRITVSPNEPYWHFLCER